MRHDQSRKCTTGFTMPWRSEQTFNSPIALTRLDDREDISAASRCVGRTHRVRHRAAAAAMLSNVWTNRAMSAPRATP